MRKRILTALLAAAMISSALAGCYTEVPAPDDESSKTNVTTSAESKTTTTKPSSTTTASSTTTTSAQSTSSKKTPTTATFRYSLIKRLKETTNNGGTGGTGGGTGSDTTTQPPTDDVVNENEYFYDTYRSFVDVGDAIMAQAKKNINYDDPVSGGLWRPSNQNVAVSLNNKPDENGNIGILSDATLWPYGAYMEGVGAQIADNPKGSYFSMPEYEKLLENVTRFTDNRYNTTDSLGLCCVQGGGPAQVFNDDNVWIALEWINAYELLKDPQYLTLAKRNLNFIYESWDETTLGGGIWWMRPGTEGGEARQKNACINAPFAWAAAEMYQLTEESKYLEQAKNAYNWTKENLWDDRNLIQDKWAQDPATGNYSKDGSIYAYNTGCMIGAGAVLYQITEDPTYRDDAYKLAEGSRQNFFSPRMEIRSSSEDAVEGATGHYFASISPQGDDNRCWFRSNLVRGIYELYNVDKAMGNDADPQYARIALNAISVAAVTAGRLGDYVNPGFSDQVPSLAVITPTSQGAVARMMYMSSKFLKDNPDFERIPD